MWFRITTSPRLILVGRFLKRPHTNGVIYETRPQNRIVDDSLFVIGFDIPKHQAERIQIYSAILT